MRFENMYFAYACIAHIMALSRPCKCFMHRVPARLAGLIVCMNAWMAGLIVCMNAWMAGVSVRMNPCIAFLLYSNVVKRQRPFS